MERLTLTDKEMDEIRGYVPDFDCPVKAEEGDIVNKFCDTICDEFQSNCPFMKMGQKLKIYEDAEEQGLLLRNPKDLEDAILNRMKEFMDEYRSYSESSIDHFGGKADSMETAMRIVKGAFNDYMNRF